MADRTNIDADYKDVILNNVNLHDGYALSNNWIGYFERNKRFEMKYIREAITFFEDFFKSEIENIVVATSLYIDTDSSDRNKYTDIEMRLCGEDYIKMISGSAVFDDDSAIYNQQVRDIESSFRWKNG